MKDTEKFKALLDEHHDWPSPYAFKFVVPKEQTPLLEALFEEGVCSTRNSRTGRYVSLTAEMQMSSSEEVLTVYRKVSRIEGIISL